MSEYRFTRINKDLYPKIKSLYKLSFGIEETLEQLEKKYDTSVFGLRDIGVLAEAQDSSPAAYYGVFPIRMSYRGQEILAAQSGDTMTSPLHQKKGLFIQLAKETYKLAAENKVTLVYGFPNENSYPGFKNKLEWQFTGLIQNYSITNPTLPLSEIAYKYNSFQNTYRAYARMRLSKYMVALNEENANKINADDTGVTKDIRFVEYKMRSPDVYLINVNGFIFLIKANNHLQIGATARFEKKQLPHFIETVKNLGTLLGCSRTVFDISKNYWLNEFLNESLTATEGMSIGFYRIDKSLKLEEFAFTLADFDTF